MMTSAILIKNGTILPESMDLESEPCSGEWRCVTNLDRRGLDNQLSKAGWIFFYMAGMIRKSAFAFGEDRAAQIALGRAIADVQSQGCNCLEIIRVSKRYWLRLTHLSIFAHARHIQHGSLFLNS